MKKVTLIFTLLLALLLAGCGAQQAAKDGDQKTADNSKTVTLKVGATPVPHSEILKAVQPVLEKEGVKLQIVEYTDYTTPNMSLDAGDLDANYFQHEPYLKDFDAKKGTKLLSAAKIHFEPMGLYTKKVKAIADFKAGDKIGVPGDATNGGRALVLLEKAGLIKLKPGLGITATVRDIVEKKVEVVEMEAAQLPRSLEDLDGAVINGNYAVQANLSPKDALISEDAKSEAANTYANIIAVKQGNEKNAAIEKLVKALQSPEVKKFIDEKYKGAVIPVF